MAVHKRKKNVRYRGSKTHGGGSMKKRRGAGHRGGRGNAGTGKRADVKKPNVEMIKNYFGKHGFVGIGAIKRGINIRAIDDNFGSWSRKGIITIKGNIAYIDLAALGKNKLLATGHTKRAYHITAEYASPAAIEKIKSAGGTVLLTEVKEEEKPAAPADAKPAPAKSAGKEAKTK